MKALKTRGYGDRPRLPGHPPSLLQRDRCAGGLSRGGQDDLCRAVEVGQPTGVSQHGNGARSGADPPGNWLPVEPHVAQWTPAGIRPGRPDAFGGERSLGDSDRRQSQDGTHVDGEPAAPRVVQSGAVDQQHIRPLLKGGDGGRQQRPLPQGEQPGHVGRPHPPGHDALLDDVTGLTRSPIGRYAGQSPVRRPERGAVAAVRNVRRTPENGGGPRPIARVTRSRLTGGVGEEAPSDQRILAEPDPEGRTGGGLNRSCPRCDGFLLGDQLLGRVWPTQVSHCSRLPRRRSGSRLPPQKVTRSLFGVGRVAGLSAAETRDRLIEAAAEVFAECGYDGARTSQIARRAGLSTGAIYSQYGTKAELLLAAVQAHAPAELERFFQSDGAAAPDVSFLDVMQTLGADLPYRARPLAGMLVEAWSAARRDGEVADVLRAAAAQRQGVLTRMFAAGQDAGEVDGAISADALARFCLLLVFGSIVAQNAGLEPPPPADWAELISRVVDAARPRDPKESS